ncbi:hypothetical protein [Flavobacterium sp. CAU 1735]|uniref:hypothetical protein n=1 Tax=Flavobacterium sp. CAU 1735 TaxID=3140361 RepID=UPI003261045E
MDQGKMTTIIQAGDFGLRVDEDYLGDIGDRFRTESSKNRLTDFRTTQLLPIYYLLIAYFLYLKLISINLIHLFKMKTRFQKIILLFLFSISCISVKAQNKNAIQIQILNKEIPGKGTFLLEIEISNPSDKTYVFPLDSNSLNTYAREPGEKEILTDIGTAEQILLGIRVKNSLTGVYPENGVSMPSYIPTPLEEPFLVKQYEMEDYKNAEIIKIYRKLGFKENKNWILDFNYLKDNLMELNPGEKKILYFVFNLNEFTVKSRHHLIEVFEGQSGFSIYQEDYIFFIELQLEKNFLAPFYKKMQEVGFIEKTAIPYSGIIRSNAVPIKPTF